MFILILLLITSVVEGFHAVPIRTNNREGAANYSPSLIEACEALKNILMHSSIDITSESATGVLETKGAEYPWLEPFLCQRQPLTQESCRSPSGAQNLKTTGSRLRSAPRAFFIEMSVPWVCLANSAAVLAAPVCAYAVGASASLVPGLAYDPYTTGYDTSIGFVLPIEGSNALSRKSRWQLGEAALDILTAATVLVVLVALCYMRPSGGKQGASNGRTLAQGADEGAEESDRRKCSSETEVSRRGSTCCSGRSCRHR